MTILRIVASCGIVIVGHSVARMIWKTAVYKFMMWTGRYNSLPWIWSGHEKEESTMPWIYKSLPILLIFGKGGCVESYLGLHKVHDTNKVRPVTLIGAGANFKPAITVSDSRYFSQIINDLESFPKYQYLYNVYELILGKGLVTAKGDHHKKQRKLITPVFHFAALKSALTVLERNAAAFFAEELPRSNFIIGQTTFKAFTLGVIVDYAFSGAFDKRWMHHAWSNIMNLFRLQFLAIMFIGRFVRYFPNPFNIYLVLVRWRLRRFVLNRQRFLESHHITQDKVLRALGEEEAADADRAGKAATGYDGEFSIDLGMNLADQLILADCPASVVVEECMTFLFAGEDTTNSLLSFAAYELARCPAEQDRVRAEAHAVLGPGPASGVSLDAVKKLERLQAVLKETLRLWPPVCLIPREVGRSDFEVAGLAVPKGTAMDLGIFMAHRDPEIWPEPDDFRPSRWFLPADSEEVRRRHPYAYLPFSAGSRNCIGQKFAMQEATVMMAMLLTRFELRPAPGSGPVSPVVAGIMEAGDLAVECRPIT